MTTAGARVVPGRALLSWPAVASAALIVVNDVWLKAHHPSWLSGKLSDVGLVVFLPLVIGAALEWTAFATGRRVPSRALDVVACVVGIAYFVAVKTWPLATQAHVASLTALLGRRFRAVSDPTDLVCLPFSAIAWWTMARSGRGRVEG